MVKNEYLKSAKILIQQEFSDLTAAYWLGSLAHGGFSEHFSDIDFALIYSKLPDNTVMEEKIFEWKKNLPEGERWSFFWGDSNCQGGRFPTPDVIDLVDNGVLLYGSSVRPKKPEINELQHYLKSHSIPYWINALDESLDNKALVRLALYPARFLYSWNTGKITSNEEAVAISISSNWPVNKKLLLDALEIRRSGNVLNLNLNEIRDQLFATFKRVESL